MHFDVMRGLLQVATPFSMGHPSPSQTSFSKYKYRCSKPFSCRLGRQVAASQYFLQLCWYFVMPLTAVFLAA